MKGLAGKRVIVTGAGQGIGRAVALHLSEAGARVVVMALHQETAEETRDLIREKGLSAASTFGDLGSMEGARGQMDRALDELGGVDILVNNAGWTLTTPFLEESVEYWEKVARVNFWAPIYMSRLALERMVPQGKGTIVNVVSDAGRVGTGGEAVYAASKAGVVALTKSLAQEMARYGIRVNAVSPGPTATRILTENAQDPAVQKKIERMIQRTPMRKVAEPEEVAGAVAFLASELASHITGQVLSVNGGLVMA